MYREFLKPHISFYTHSSVQSLSRVRLFATPWTAAHQASCPSPTPGACSNSCPLSQWCHPTISSSVIPFSSSLQSFPASRSFPMSQFFASGDQNIGVLHAHIYVCLSSQGYGFSYGHVWMWELDCEEGLAPKNWCFWTVVLEKTLESPLDCKEIQPVHSEGDQPWVFFGGNDAKAETPVLWPPHAKSWLIGKDSDAGRDWEQEEKGMTEDEMTGWHHQFDGCEFERTPGVGDGQGGLACWFMGSQRVRHDWATELNWRWHELLTYTTWTNFKGLMLSGKNVNPKRLHTV